MPAGKNPYAAPDTSLGAPVDLGGPAQLERIRYENVAQERAIQEAGVIICIAGCMSMPLLFLFFGLLLGPLFSLFIIGVGIMLFRLAPWARWPAIGIAVAGLAFVPLGTLVFAWKLLQLLSRKTRYVMSAEYASVIAATKGIVHVKSFFDWCVFVNMVFVFWLFGALMFWIMMILFL